MIDRFLSRLQAQKLANVNFSEPQATTNSAPESAEHETPCPGALDQNAPLSPDEIGYYLNKLEVKEQTMETPSAPNSITFESLSMFFAWYKIHEAKFSAAQQAALNTLGIALQKINYGCSCRKDARIGMANQYYKTFFSRNSETDIMTAIKLIAQVDTLIFLLDGQEFLRSDTPKI